jgi:hypothetical protein
VFDVELVKINGTAMEGYAEPAPHVHGPGCNH